MTDPRFLTTPWIFGAPDGLSSDLHTAAELEAAWEAMRGRIRELERDNNRFRGALVKVERIVRQPGPPEGPDSDMAYQMIEDLFNGDIFQLQETATHEASNG